MDRSGYLKKLYFKQWTIGLTYGNIGEILRTGKFDKEVNWLKPESATRFQADPFPLMTEKGLSIIYEDFDIDGNYGNISVMNLGKDMDVERKKVLLDTGSHMSFPFIFTEEQKIFIFPESVKAGNVCCYEYDPWNQTLDFICEVIKMPLYDPAILKRDGKYWLFGSIYENRADYKLHIFHSEKLTGPYLPLAGNPVRNGLDATRAAGNFIESGGELFRPAQNCSKEYGESITINRVTRLDDNGFDEEPHMVIRANERERQENGIHNIHTLNVLGDLIILDGMKWTFSLREQWRNFKRNRRLLRENMLNEVRNLG